MGSTTAERLIRIELAEKVVKNSTVRVRDIDGAARIEVGAEDMEKILNFDTASCSIDVVTICPVPFITPCIAILFDSVPPDVNKISPGNDPISAATSLRAMFIVFSAARPYP